MNFQKIILAILGIVVVAVAYRGYGWPGVALTATGIVMWMLLHFTRMMKVLQRASNRPVGYCDSAVMLNAKLRPGVNITFTSLGRYDVLLEHISAHRWYMGIEQDRPIEWQEAVLDWYDNIYLPVVNVISEKNILAEFPGRSLRTER